MVNSFIAKKDLDSEMTVVRNEFESGENDPDTVLAERILSTAYLWHNYGKDTIGSRADIENVPIERLQAFWRTYYQPDNAYLLIAGRFDEAKTLAKVNRIFGKHSAPEARAPEDLHGRAGAGRRAARRPPARGRRAGARRRLPRPVRPAPRLRRRGRARPQS